MTSCGAERQIIHAPNPAMITPVATSISITVEFIE
jgi:hypothetical protein